MNAIEMLKRDHTKVQGLFRQFEAAGAGAHERKEEIAEKTFTELETHTSLEQEIFYPALDQEDDHTGHEIVTEALEEHSVVKRLIEELRALSPSSDEYEAKFTVMAENVRHHIREEEGEMFSHAQNQLSAEELNELGRQMARRKEDLTGPSLLGQTFQKAKTMVGEAVSAMVGSPTAKTKRHSAGATSRRARGTRTTESTRHKKTRRSRGTTTPTKRAAARKTRASTKSRRAVKGKRRTTTGTRSRRRSRVRPRGSGIVPRRQRVVTRPWAR